MKIIVIILFLTSLSSCYSRPKEKTGLEGKLLPSFTLLLMDSLTQFNTINIPEGKPIVLFYFNPSCPYCRAEMEEIIDNVKNLGNIRFYIFSTAPLQEVKNFSVYYKLKTYQNLVVGQDYSSYFGDYFKVQAVPYLAIYDTHKRLKQVFLGKVGINDIKSIAFE